MAKLAKITPKLGVRRKRRHEVAPSTWEDMIGMWRKDDPSLLEAQLLSKEDKEGKEDTSLPQAQLVAMPSIMGGSVPQAPLADGPTTDAQDAGAEDMELDDPGEHAPLE